MRSTAPAELQIRDQGEIRSADMGHLHAWPNSGATERSSPAFYGRRDFDWCYCRLRRPTNTLPSGRQGPVVLPFASGIDFEYRNDPAYSTTRPVAAAKNVDPNTITAPIAMVCIMFMRLSSRPQCGAHLPAAVRDQGDVE
jgi:hypothetical protein